MKLKKESDVFVKKAQSVKWIGQTKMKRMQIERDGESNNQRKSGKWSDKMIKSRNSCE